MGKQRLNINFSFLTPGLCIAKHFVQRSMIAVAVAINITAGGEIPPKVSNTAAKQIPCSDSTTAIPHAIIKRISKILSKSVTLE